MWWTLLGVYGSILFSLGCDSGSELPDGDRLLRELAPDEVNVLCESGSNPIWLSDSRDLGQASVLCETDPVLESLSARRIDDPNAETDVDGSPEECRAMTAACMLGLGEARLTSCLDRLDPEGLSGCDATVAQFLGCEREAAARVRQAADPLRCDRLDEIAVEEQRAAFEAITASRGGPECQVYNVACHGRSR